MYPKSITFRNYINFSEKNSSKMSFGTLYFTSMTLKKKFSYFSEYVKTLYDAHAPTETKKGIRPRAPWLALNFELIFKNAGQGFQ